MINRQHKDRLFRAIFGYEKYKGNLLSLYNALNDKDYTNPEVLEITTIDDVIYMGIKNDISSICILDSVMTLYEHQSCFSSNLPLRGLMYFGKLYGKYIEKNRLNIYGRKLVKIPVPQYFVFYNGTEEYPDHLSLRLSDAFYGKMVGENFDRDANGDNKNTPFCLSEEKAFEWTAVMLNINYGKNKSLMEKCKILREYAILIDIIRRYQQEMEDAELSVTIAVDECISRGILKDFLQEHKAEVVDMCLTEYNEEETMRMFQEEAREEGMKEGMKEGLLQLVRDGLLAKEEAAKRLGMTIEEIEQNLAE